MSKLQVVRLKDYRPSAFKVEHQDLLFILNEEEVRVIHKQHIVRDTKAQDSAWGQPEKDLILNGEQLKLERIHLNDKELKDSKYQLTEKTLVIKDVPEQFTLETEVLLFPDQNKELSGLYRSNGIYCTQCEAEGFRRISFALDRPDVLSTYRVRIEADKTQNPVLLSNGNLEDSGDLDDNRHFTVWHDPHPKPSYLFALVAGKLGKLSHRITQNDGSKVELNIYCEEAFVRQTSFAMQSLIEAMHWDEKRFKLRYDLKRFNIVAISDFNMGAMENKSLNIFNTKFILGDINTATDQDFHAIQAVIGHEYFHNWTGNRVTCRDWFQLSLKEGLTVFRDQEFSSDLNERDLERIRNVELLRAMQFSEDQSPLRHPVQPQEYAAIDNFYTATVYEKGAEIIRMYHTIMGEKAFQEGMRLYFERFDGQAVRIEDFAQCMQDASGFPFSEQFFNWYTTAGTPKLYFTSAYNHSERTFTLTVKQDINAVEPARPLLIPIRIALLTPNGRPYRFEGGEYTKTILLDKIGGSWSFERTDGELIPVLMLDFSAPVIYHHNYNMEELAVIVRHSDNGFARYEAMQKAYQKLYLISYKTPSKTKEALNILCEMMQDVLHHEKHSAGEKALLLKLPNFDSFLPLLEKPWDIDKALSTYERMQRVIALKLRNTWNEYLENDQEKTLPRYSAKDAGIRALRGVLLQTLSLSTDEIFREKLLERYQNAKNMSERMYALESINLHHDKVREEALQAFYQKFSTQPLVIDKWFALQGKDQSEGAFERIQSLSAHPDFNPFNPNRFRALIGSFITHNPKYFHQKDGAGYEFVCTQIERILNANPQLSARILGQFSKVVPLDDERKALLREKLSRLQQQATSTDVQEILQSLLTGLSS